MHPVTKTKRAHPTTEPPLKRGTGRHPPLSFSFAEALAELKRRFEEEPDKRSGNKIVAYLRKNFHQQFTFDSVTALNDLYGSLASAPQVASYVRLFAKKDAGFAFSRLPKEIRNHIFSYLGPDDFEGAKTFFRGDYNNFIVHWINTHKCSFFDTVSYKPKELNYFIDNYGVQIEHLAVTQHFRQIGLEIEKFPNLTYLKLSHVFLTQFPEFVSRLPSGLKKLSYLRTGITNDLQLRYLSHLTNLEALSLKYPLFVLNFEVVEVLKQFKHFTALNLKWSCNRDLGFYQQLAGLDLLKLNLEGTNITHIEIEPFTSFTRLRTLKIGGNQLGIRGKEIIGSLTSLTKLSLQGDKTYHSLGWENFSRLVALTDLNLAGTEMDDNASLVLGVFTRLRSLNLHRTGIMEQGIRTIARLTSLTRLNLGEVPINGGTLHLEALTRLEVLDLKEHKKVSIVAFRKMTRLTSLNLEGVKLTYREFRLLGSFTALKYLNLMRSGVNDRILSLFSFPRLTTLDCSHNGITRQGVVPLITMTNLVTLSLSKTKIGDAGAHMLLSLPRLKNVTLMESCSAEEEKKVLRELKWRNETS